MKNKVILPTHLIQSRPPHRAEQSVFWCFSLCTAFRTEAWIFYGKPGRGENQMGITAERWLPSFIIIIKAPEKLKTGRTENTRPDARRWKEGTAPIRWLENTFLCAMPNVHERKRKWEGKDDRRYHRAVGQEEVHGHIPQALFGVYGCSSAKSFCVSTWSRSKTTLQTIWYLQVLDI